MAPLKKKAITEPTTADYSLAAQNSQDPLRLIICGNADDGKSTLIGRLHWESQQICDDQLASQKLDSKRNDAQGELPDLALLADALAAEGKHGVATDVTYRFLSTSRRKFIVADIYNHEHLICNLVTNGLTADLAIILFDARQDVQTQTRRHAYFVSLMGIRHIILAINKIDLAGLDTERYLAIEANFITLADSFGFDSITTIPLSALYGDNISSRSNNTPWFQGPTLLELLETISIKQSKDNRFVFPVQTIDSPQHDFCGINGTVASGSITIGDSVRVTASGQTARVERLIKFDCNLQEAHYGDVIKLILDREVNASQGDIISASTTPLDMTDQFEATLIWTHADAGLVGRNYELKLANQLAGASITSIKYCINASNLVHESCRQLGINTIAVCNLALSQPLVVDTYKLSPTLGRFILLDRFSHAVVAVGLINHNLRRAQNVHRQALSITRHDRERLNGHKGKVIWFTGLSGSGKSTLANALEQAMHAQGKRTYILDGDNIRQGLNKDLGFTDADRVENIRRVAEVAKLMMDAGLLVMTAFISPFRAEREMARQLIGHENFIEVFVDTPLDICEQRDPKGLYKKARNGQLPNMTGINSPYEKPLGPTLSIDSHFTSVEDATRRLVELLDELK